MALARKKICPILLSRWLAEKSTPRVSTLAAAIMVLLSVPALRLCVKTCDFAAAETSPPATEKSRQQPRIPLEKVKMATFLTSDGRYVQAKVVSEDKNILTVAEFVGSTITLTSYNKTDIEPRSIRYTSLPESRYWEDAAEYFLARTWDFQDDPDDFVQAIRCYEQAKSLVTGAYGPDYELALQLEQKVQKARANRALWAAEAQSRATLKQLELEAAFEQRIQRIEQQLRQNSEQLNRLSGILEDTRLGANLAEIQRNLQTWSQALRSDIERNRRDINELYYLQGRTGRMRSGSITERRITGGTD